MKFLEIRRDIRNDKIIGYKMVSREEIIKLHPLMTELRAWADGARLNSRFDLSTSLCKFKYIRLDKLTDKDIEAWCK